MKYKFKNYNRVSSFLRRKKILNPGALATSLLKLYTEGYPTNDQLGLLQLPIELFNGLNLDQTLENYLLDEREYQASRVLVRSKAPAQNRDSATQKRLYRYLSKHEVSNAHTVAAFMVDHPRLEGTMVPEKLRAYGLCPNPGDIQALAQQLRDIGLIKYEGNFNRWWFGPKLERLLTRKPAESKAAPANEVLVELAKAQVRIRELEAENKALQASVKELETPAVLVVQAATKAPTPKKTPEEIRALLDAQPRSSAVAAKTPKAETSTEAETPKHRDAYQAYLAKDAEWLRAELRRLEAAKQSSYTTSQFLLRLEREQAASQQEGAQAAQ